MKLVRTSRLRFWEVDELKYFEVARKMREYQGSGDVYANSLLHT